MQDITSEQTPEQPTVETPPSEPTKRRPGRPRKDAAAKIEKPAEGSMEEVALEIKELANAGRKPKERVRELARMSEPPEVKPASADPNNPLDLHVHIPEPEGTAESDADSEEQHTEKEAEETTAPDEALVKEIVDLGVPQSTAESMTSEQLLAFRAAYDQQFIKAAEADAPAPQPEPKTPEPEPTNGQPPPPPAKTEPFKVELDPDLHDEGVVKAFDSLNQHYTTQLSQQAKAMTKFRNEVAAGMKALFGVVGEMYSGIEDKAFRDWVSDQKLPVTADDAAAIKEAASKLARGRSRFGKGQLSKQELWTRALFAVKGPDLLKSKENEAREGMKAKIRDSQGKFVQRPSHRETETAAQSGDAAGIAKVAEFMRKRGMR